jgi:hypothetical protein
LTAVASRVVGRVAQIWVYPVRSLAGTPLETARVDDGGLAGDRIRTVVDATGTPLRSKDAPVLATLPARTDDAALSAALGRPVHLEELPPSPAVAPVHLVSRQALDRAAGGAVPDGCSPEDPRANLVLDLAEGEDERTWVGHLARISGVALEITRTPKHCLGVYASVWATGTVSVGDPVLL